MSGLNTALYALNGASTVSQFAVQRKQANAIQRAGTYEQAAYNQNASFADEQAADAIARGQTAELRQRVATRQFRGAQRAELASQGIDVGSGSALDLQDETVAMGELDALTIRNNARRLAYGFNVQAGDLRRQGILAELAAQNQAGALRAASYGTLLTGIGNTLSIYQRFHNDKPKKEKLPKGTMVNYTSGLGSA
jgi:hypothetical protein